MLIRPGHRSGRTLALVLGTTIALLGPVADASAEDGVQNFFSSLFGGGQQQAQPAPSVPQSGGIEVQSASRPLTVKLRRPKVARYAAVPTKPGKVSIFQDKTLRRGDAVMTRHGMRIFAGSSSWPYQDGDFVAIADAGHMNKDIQKTLVSLDQLPRN